MTKAEIKRECQALAMEAARKIGASAWYEHAKEILSDAERAEVDAMWQTMPGSSCWMDAFFAWMQTDSV